MKRLIAARPIQYMGRTYDRADTLPAHDPVMVAAWLAAGTATWTGEELAVEASKATDNAEHLAALCLRDMGVTIQDENGAFVGTDALEEQIKGLVAATPETLTDTLDAAELATLKKGELEKLAQDMGVDISTAKNNEERAAMIAEAAAKAPTDGGAQ